ncbi:MAG: hypothetical protein JNL90_18810 [Planctomycetes bacterium]|nr:hypothetical protein [Planctomycetota bacterium]
MARRSTVSARPFRSDASRGRAALPPLLVLLLVAIVATVSSLLVSGVPRLELPHRTPVRERTSNGHAGDAPSPAWQGTERESTLDAAQAALANGSARLDLAFVDAEDGRPLADLLFTVYREEEQPLVLTRGASDRRGRATLDALPEGEVVIATERRVPHAAALAVATLKRGTVTAAELRLDFGGEARGRVVDDRGRPLAGIAILLDPRPGPAELAELAPLFPDDPALAERFAEAAACVAVSGADGRYLVEALGPRPLVWRAPGRVVGVERAGPVTLFVDDDGAYDEQPADFAASGDSRRCDVADLVLPRPVAFGGVVVDAAGQPIAGALVTASTTRALWSELTRPLGAHAPAELCAGVAAAELPDEPDFTLGRGEARTLANGRFELDPVPASSSELHVLLRDGSLQSFPVDSLPPGERRRDLRLEWRRRTELFLELADADGAPHGETGELPVRLLRHDGSALQGSARPLAEPGRFALISELPPEQLRALQLTPSDAHPLLHRFAEPPPRRATVALALTRCARLRLALVRSADTPPDVDATLRLHACLARAAARAESGLSCCGYGSETVAWFAAHDAESDPLAPTEAAPLEVELQVERTADYWIEVSGPFGDDGAEQAVEFGPFAADAAPARIELPRLHAAPAAAADAASREPPLLSRAVEATLQDEQDGAPIEGAALRASGGAAPGSSLAHGDAPPLQLGWTSGDDGRLFDYVAAEATAVWFVAPGFAPSAPRPLPEGGGAVDLGTIALQPLPAWRLKLLDAGGRPLRSEPRVRVVDADPDAPIEPRFERDGKVALRGALAERFLLEVALGGRAGGEELGAALERRYELPLTRWPAHATPAVALPLLREVVVEVALPAVAVERRESSLALEVAPQGEVRGVVTPRRASERDSTDPLRRRFALLLPPGRYVASGRALLMELASAEFTVAADGPQPPIVLDAR